MTAARRLAAILAADVVVREHPGWRVREPRQGQVTPRVNLPAQARSSWSRRTGDSSAPLRPDPEQTLVASDRTARIDGLCSLIPKALLADLWGIPESQRG